MFGIFESFEINILLHSKSLQRLTLSCELEDQYRFHIWLLAAASSNSLVAPELTD